MIADELRHDAKHDPTLAAYSADLETIEAQITLCKAALAKIGMQGVAAAESDTGAVQLSADDYLAKPANLDSILPR